MVNENCRYCTRDYSDIAVKVADLETSTLILTKDQTNAGRCILALNAHKTEFFQLDSAEQASFTRDLAKASRALDGAFKPDKINYAAFGDMYPHFHVHLVPKYKDGPAWGMTSVLNLDPAKVASPSELDTRAELIRNHL